MQKTNSSIARDYYVAMGNKDMAGIERLLHPNVAFIGPLASLTGKEAVVEAAKRFQSFFNSLVIRAVFSDETQAMLAYDFDCPPPVGFFSGATLMTIKDNLIIRLELFYDARPFEKKKDEIFSQN